jgi:hypothetical protein
MGELEDLRKYKEKNEKSERLGRIFWAFALVMAGLFLPPITLWQEGIRSSNWLTLSACFGLIIMATFVLLSEASLDIIKIRKMLENAKK